MPSMAPEPIKQEYNTNPGDYLVIQITGCVSPYIAEVIQHNPLHLKVEESGPYANLRGEDFIIMGRESAAVQRDHRDNTCEFLTQIQLRGGKVLSGLYSLGVVDGRLHEILPG